MNSDFLDRDLRVDEFVLVEIQPLHHGFAALHIIFGGVDAIQRHDPAVAIIDNLKTARIRIAADDITVMAGGQANGLQA